MNRDLKFDGIKFIMIFLVVLGHLGYNDYGLGINRVIYSFHMPVFIFLSGYFTSQNTNREKQIKWLKQTLLIYLFAQITHFAFEIGIEGAKSLLKHEAFNMSVFTWRVLISPRLALWYLICLMYWRVAVWRVFTKVSDIKLLSFSCVLALGSGIIPIDHDFAFQRAFAFFPFFVLGMTFRKHGLMTKLSKIPYSFALIGLFVGLVIARYFPTYMPKFHYGSLHDPIWRIIQSGLGLYLCLLVIRVLQIDFIERFAKYGVYTLWIYIGHTYLIKIGDYAFQIFGIKFNVFTAFLLTCAYCTLFICMAKAFHTYKENHN